MSDELLAAIQTRDLDRLAALLAAGADPNEGGKSRYVDDHEFPLQAAIGELKAYGENDPGGPEPAGSIDAVVLLLRHGARVKGWELKDGDPLLIAVFMNHIEAVRLLLATGAEPNLKDDEGYSPLRLCAQKGYLEMARLLLLCGATKTIDEAGGGGSGMNALGMAAYWLNVEMVRLLLAHRADPNALDNDRETVFERLESRAQREDLPLDATDQDRLREIRRLLGEPSE